MTTAYPLVRRLLGTLADDWRTERPDPIEFLTGHADEACDDVAAVATELDELCESAGSEYDYVSVIVESGARFTPYTEYGSAELFLTRLRDRLAEAAAHVPASARAAEVPALTSAPVPAARVATGLSACPRLHSLLVMLYAKGCATTSRVLEEVEHGLGRLVEVADVDPGAIAAELAELLEEGRSEADFAEVVARSGAHFTYDAACPTTGDLLVGLRERLVSPVAAGPEMAGTPAAVIEGTLAALKRGDLHPAMTGLVRMYGVPELRIADFPAFEARVGDLLDHVLPSWVADYVDDATQVAQTVADDADWTRARSMRSALELLVTTYRDRAAAEFVDRAEIARIDALLTAPTCHFGVAVGRTAPRFPNSHWWWVLDPPAESAANRAGLPMHPRWYPGRGVWRIELPMPGDGGAGASAELAERMVRGTLSAFGDLFEPRTATAMVQALGADGAVLWADASLGAEVRGDHLVVTDPDLAHAPVAGRVVTAATVRGAFGRGGHRAALSVELLRRRGDDDREVTSGGCAVLVVDAELEAVDNGALTEVLRAWEDELGAPISDWRSSTRPTMVSRYGWGPGMFGADAALSRPLLHGVSRHLWRGELRPGLAGLCRVFGAGVLDGIDGTAWREDWIAALANGGRRAVEVMFADLVDTTRLLDYPRWHLLCAVRSGAQLVADELQDERLAGLFPVAGMRALDDAMRSFGRRFGPVPAAHVPGDLYERHPWWRFPSDEANAGEPVELGDLVDALWAELDRPLHERRSKAPTRSLASVLRTARRVAEGEAAGFTERSANDVCTEVTEHWDLGAAMSDDLLRYFQPIAQGSSWPLPGQPDSRAGGAGTRAMPDRSP
ncbi:MAG: hypothetical protein GEV10_12870 [Streptosporangiales bacterium]|nr:hypothetical protein [Streptosporangiales bacterium]